MSLLAHQPLGQLLIGRGFLQAPQLDSALQEQRRCNHQKLLGEILIEMSFCSQTHVSEALACAEGIPFAGITPRLADPRVVSLLPHDYLTANGVLPLFLVEDVLTIAVSEPANLFLLEEIERRTGYSLQVVAATAHDIRATLEAYLPEEQVFVVDDIGPEGAGQSFTLLDRPPRSDPKIAAPDQPAILKLIEYSIRHALAEGASEIHFEPSESGLRIRFRIDGRLCEKLRPPRRLHAGLLTHVKEMTGLDSAQCALPQDGRMRLRAAGRTLTVHASTIPAHFGENLVLRIGADDAGPLKLEKLGFGYEMLKHWRKLIAQRAGLILITGPSGSGRRATLYSALQERNGPDSNLCAIEDAIEHPLPGVNQFPIDEPAGFGFPAALRAVLRQEPDVLMVSDIPDVQTGRLCAQAALSGKLVLAAMHSADTLAALGRLMHLGVEPHLLGATVTGVLGLRLARRLCPHCREGYEPGSAERRQLDRHAANITTLFRARGCERCRNTGFAGRVGIQELLIPDANFADRLGQGAAMSDLRPLAQAAGLTSLDEIFRITT